ncbi:GumC family protein [Megasphaera vaginalis (ex Bordigoni et al. 2020)]|uniref:GumC family protein n=1 Tax=Megasphaera vaginalis (ex Bordigoni et al. 2020) TaxID=2045301 RepID=UPI000C7CBA5E|nr:GumC family protein [Megasphaera vaginalis (ex Bordigoni et al. 2020)]
MDEQVIDLKELYDVLIENKKTIAKVTVAFLVAAGLYLLIVPPTYQSVSLLRVKQDKGLGSSILESLPTGGGMDSKQRMNTDAEILKSRNVIVPVIRQTEEPDSDGAFPDYEDYVKNRIITKPYKDTEILEVDVTGKTPEDAQKANTLIVQGFLNRLTQLSHDEQKNIREFLQKRATSSKEELTDAENKLQAYQVANKIYSSDDQMKALADKLSEIDKAKAENQLNMETAKAALSSVNGQLSSAGQSVADSPAIQQYKTQLAQLEAQKASYAGKYTAEHPKMQEVTNQINQVRASLNQEIDNIVAQQAPSSNMVQQGLLADKFKNEAAIAVEEGKKQALDNLDAENNAIIATLPAKEQGYIRVKRDADVAQEIYIMLAKRLEEAKVAEVMVPNEVQVVDTATLPDKPIKPRKLLTVLLALIMGLFCSSGYLVAKYLLNRKIRTTDDVETHLGLPVLGIIPDANTLEDYETDSLNIMDKMKSIRSKVWHK